MAITDRDIDLAASGARRRAYNRMMADYEADDARAEVVEEARATMPLAEQVTNISEEYVLQEALHELLKGDGWLELCRTDWDEAETKLYESMLRHAIAYDIKHNRK